MSQVDVVSHTEFPLFFTFFSVLRVPTQILSFYSLCAQISYPALTSNFKSL